MPKIAFRIAYAIILAGLFVMVIFTALAYDSLTPNFYIVLLPLIIFLLLFGFAIGQNMAFPILELLQDAYYFLKGEYGAKHLRERKDELGQLAKAFSKIAQELDKNKSEVKSLDLKIHLRTKALEEIIKLLEQKLKNRTADFQKMADGWERSQNQLKFRDKEILTLRSRIIKRKKRK